MHINNLNESPLVIGATAAKRPTSWWLAAILVVAVGSIGIRAVVATLYNAVVPNASGAIAAQGMEFFTYFRSEPVAQAVAQPA